MGKHDIRFLGQFAGRWEAMLIGLLSHEPVRPSCDRTKTNAGRRHWVPVNAIEARQRLGREFRQQPTRQQDSPPSSKRRAEHCPLRRNYGNGRAGEIAHHQ